MSGSNLYAGIAGYVNEYASLKNILPSLSPHLFPGTFNRRTDGRPQLFAPGDGSPVDVGRNTYYGLGRDFRRDRVDMGTLSLFVRCVSLTRLFQYSLTG